MYLPLVLVLTTRYFRPVDNLTPVGRIIVWTFLALLSALLVTYVPSMFGFVADDEKYGRFVGRTLFLPMFVVSLISGVCFARGRRRLAFWIVGLMLAGLVALELNAIWSVLARRQ